MPPGSPKQSAARQRVRTYFATLPEPARRRLRELQRAIRAAAPEAEVAFSYQIPAYRLNGRIVVWYAAFTRHCSLFPMTPSIRRQFTKELSGYKVAKGTVRFSMAKPIPTTLVKRLVRARIALMG